MSRGLTHPAKEILMPLKAVCVVKGDSVNGQVFFSQDDEGAVVRVTGEINGLSPGPHGISVNQFGDVTNGCTSTGPHFNPRNCEHGGPNTGTRHVGDLGNLTADEASVGSIDLIDNAISLYGPDSIVGRSFVIYADQDDHGFGDYQLSKTTGNAGKRLACGVIGITR
jgi:Cu-Zn family superoxide dismutase